MGGCCASDAATTTKVYEFTAAADSLWAFIHVSSRGES